MQGLHSVIAAKILIKKIRPESDNESALLYWQQSFSKWFFDWEEQRCYFKTIL
jgi:hypothetical protein